MAANYNKHTELIVREQSPFNAEPPKKLLAKSFLTPNDIFYVRNHAPVPQIKEEDYSFTVNGLVNKPLKLTMKDIKSDRFTKVKIISSLQCAGNRRTELVEVAPLSGEITWGEQAISNAEWLGIPLREVLELCGVKPEAKHVEFIGLDEVKKKGKTFGFGGSIEVHKAMQSEVLLAYEMNGKPLPPIHGYPLRVVVPGYIAARSIKWLGSINLRTTPSDNYFQALAYKMFPPNVLDNNIDWEKGIMLGELSLSSVILSPEEGATVQCGTLPVVGWATAGGSRTVVRVDVSADGGKTWVQADLGEKTSYGWSLWKCQLPVSVQGPAQIACRAFDNSFNTQPEDPRLLWNLKGYMNNAIHKVNVLAMKPSAL